MSKYDLEGANINAQFITGELQSMLKVKYHADITPLQQIEKGDWIDLRAAEEKTFHPGESKKISFGISVKLPPFNEAHILPRSSLYKKTGLILVNHMGIVDETFCGEEDIWFAHLKNLSSKTVTVEKDQRICQFRIIPKMAKLNIVEVDQMEDESRGGHGSTGNF